MKIKITNYYQNKIDGWCLCRNTPSISVWLTCLYTFLCLRTKWGKSKMWNNCKSYYQTFYCICMMISQLSFSNNEKILFVTWGLLDICHLIINPAALSLRLPWHLECKCHDISVTHHAHVWHTLDPALVPKLKSCDFSSRIPRHTQNWVSFQEHTKVI